ncbi:hypothetical protein ABZV77_05500 [Streptomyces sp. NPDC004732]|uniref:hypothetical protein n=1 Tax=Streptomyces sp. NPDC004732 TaxID=3154290 RepID=UPI0033BAB36F
MIEGSRPDQLAQVENSIRDFTDAEVAASESQRRLDLAKQAVLDEVARLRDEAESDRDPSLIAVLRHVYWQQRGISSRALAEAARMHVNEMLVAIGPAPSGIACATCGTGLLRTSRSWKPSRRHAGPPLCPDCEAQKREANSRESAGYWLRVRFINEAAVSAPARDWHAATALVLAYPPLSLRVQPGSAHDLQDGIWLAWENARTIRDRLIAAVAAGDDLFECPAKETQLLVETALRMAGWDTARTRDLLDPITSESAHGLLTRLNICRKTAVEAARQRAAQLFPDASETGADGS